ncbi:hypothetical protein M3I01_013405 [Marinomonas sp. RSW2]|uniref:Uncharacterized protein n=1 Tax=Marinomonas maritima TaxID=2940935 RepID=A0ABT5WGE6_9GAMM|nr:hypothetical protein [Marinomonas maritima]MDE8603894.1 hypothetical protein [Marinomonas maritima]
MHYLPQEDNSSESLGRALWLEWRESERQTGAIANGISKAFSG